jgi:uridine kinase
MINVVVSIRGLTGSGKTIVRKIITEALRKYKLTVSVPRQQSTLETIDVKGELTDEAIRLSHSHSNNSNAT